jgi:hypothetical protein
MPIGVPYKRKGEGTVPSPSVLPFIGSSGYSPPPFVYSSFFDTDLPCMKSSM